MVKNRNLMAKSEEVMDEDGLIKSALDKEMMVE